MVDPNWRDHEFEAVEELRVELSEMIAMLGHVEVAAPVPENTGLHDKTEMETPEVAA